MNKRISAAGSLLLTLLILLNTAAPVFALSSDYTVSSREDFERLVKKCTLDSWSAGRTVDLLADIDLSGAENWQIPVFCGTFNGNGHTISGISTDKAGSHTGLFRYIRKDAVVVDLNVKGKIKPQGTKKYAGGIAGENDGTIRSCSFDGTVSGDSYIGGIAGINTDNGRIISSSAYGTVSGDQFAGGIAGKNSGLIMDSENHSSVNTVDEEKKQDINDVDTDIGSALENIETKREENSEESILPGKSDMGGIAGQSNGILQGCRNFGTIGYQHIGYNVGGIAGRQSGYILGCENHGNVYGRKDVGGIVGQSEPDILMSGTDSVNLSVIRSELNRMHNMAENFINDTDGASEKISEHLSMISKYAGTARDSAQLLADSGMDFVDDNIAEVNTQMALISDTVDKMVPIMEKVQKSTADANDIFGKLCDELDQIKIFDDDSTAPDLDDTLDELQAAIDRFSDFGDYLSTAFSQMNSALRILSGAVKVSNQSEVQAALNSLADAAGKLADAQLKKAEAVAEIENILKNSSSIGSIIQNKDKLLAALGEVRTSLKDSSAALSTIGNSLLTVVSNTKIDFSAITRGVLKTQEALSNLSEAMKYFSRGMDKLNRTLDEAWMALHGYEWDDTRSNIKERFKNINGLLRELTYTAEDVTDIVSDMTGILRDLSNAKDPEFVKLGDDFRQASDDLFSSVSDISDELSAMRDTFDTEKDKFTGNLHALSSQFNVIANLILNEIDDFKSDFKAKDLSDYIVDVSDENINSTTRGKIKGCTNSAPVEADRNVGGIAGAMSIEYTKDPEDDFEKPSAFNFVYRTKAVLQQNINEGKISGKKDAVGGIVGRLSLGTIIECENYAAAESVNGDYVGGVAGYSESSIRRSYSKAAVTGRRYVGGIAGRTELMSYCYAIANPKGEEYVGSIAGDCDDITSVKDSRYVGDYCGAVDGVSYAGRCEEITYDALRGMSGIPKRFISFTVRYIADGELAAEQDIAYGEDTARIKPVPVPEKKGYYGKWPEIQEKTVTGDIELEAEYYEWITALASEEKNESGKLSLGLAEGEFTDEAVLHIRESAENPPKVYGIGDVKVYDIEIDNADIGDTEKVGLRILNEEKKNASVWRLTDSGWEEVPVKKRGRYIKLDTEGGKSTICVFYQPAKSYITVIVMSCLLAAAIILIIMRKRIIPLISRKRKKA